MQKLSDNTILLSICISTFNRSDKLFKLVNQILLYNGNEIEVVVTDNCSTDDTIARLSEIDDSRLKLVKNSNNIGAIPNYIKAISQGNGAFVIFCTDKDSVVTSGISKIVKYFDQNNFVAAGICNLDVVLNNDNLYFDRGISGVLNLGYLSRHPTGYFFNNKLLKSIITKKDFTNHKFVGFFPFEFLITEACLLGQSSILNIPLFNIETLNDVKQIKSYSYSGVQNNLYFFPEERTKMFYKYLNHLKTLTITQKQKRLAIKKIYKDTIALVTISFKKMVQNEIICHHYGIKKRKISLIHMLYNDLKFSVNFIQKGAVLSWLERLSIFVEIHFNYIFIFKNR
jgi:glycosyltransferase involved in cell wall biosynthesis